MKEQVITSRPGRQAAKGRAGGGNVQRPAARRASGSPAGARAKGSAWKTALALLPLALKVALAVTLGVLGFVGYRTAASASFFQVKTVDVEGAQRSSRDEIRAAVRRLSAAGVWQADLAAISREVRTLPWVRAAVVSRVLPDGLRVRVAERTPAVIARTSQGRLVWADDEGVMLGAASPGEEDFFVRGLDEATGEEARRRNRERVRVAQELSREWARAGLVRRVSEVNLDDLRDVRVQLAGDDAHVEVRLGREDFAKRFRQALEVLDAQRQTPRGPFVTYVDVSQGKRAVVGTGTTAHAPLEAAAEEKAEGAGAGAAANEDARPADAARPEGAARETGRGPKPSAAKKEAVKKERAQPPKAARARKEPEKKKGAAAREAVGAVRPRRVS